MELVGVLVYHAEKVGLDSGEFVGRAPNGLLTADSPDELISLAPEAIIWSGSTDDIDAFEKILSAGATSPLGPRPIRVSLPGAWCLVPGVLESPPPTLSADPRGFCRRSNGGA
jgi:hypothetical protein